MKHLRKFNENMTFPTKEEVENGTPDQIMRWNRFLPTANNKAQLDIINLVSKRFKEMDSNGDINSSTSKSVGWNENKINEGWDENHEFDYEWGEGVYVGGGGPSGLRIYYDKKLKKLSYSYKNVDGLLSDSDKESIIRLLQKY